MSMHPPSETSEEKAPDSLPPPAAAAEPAVTADVAALAAPPTFGPVEASQRIVSIDFARGVALLGILMVNVLVFFGPLAMVTSPSLTMARQPTEDQMAFVLIMALCFSKFFPTFSMLFGYGLMGQIDRSAAAGRPTANFVGRRLGLLALFGAIHGLLLWFGDILFIYSVLGVILLLVERFSVRGLLITAVCLLAVTVLLRSGGSLAGALFAPNPAEIAKAEPIPGAAEWPAPLNELGRARFNPNSPIWIEAETRAYRDGPWTHVMVFRSLSWMVNVLSIIGMGWQILAMFMIGALLWRVRFFDPEQGWLRWRVFLICFPVGLALEGLAACFFWWGLNDIRVFSLGGVVQGFSSCILPLGYLSGLALLADALPDWARSPIASAGRMALTVYLMETVAATAIAYHWGFGLFGLVGVMTQALIGIAIWLGLVAASWLWLQFFRQGPMERLWRRLEYGRPSA